MLTPRVLHISHSDTEGGAALAALRLHRGLLKLGVHSKLVVVRKRSTDPTVIAPLGRAGELRVRSAQAVSNLAAKLQVDGNPVVHSLNWCPSGLGRWLAGQRDCFVHLHWVGAETLSLREIGSLPQPVFWTLHDMWPFCGAEHYENAETPARYSAGYSLASRTPLARGLDLDRWTFLRKRANWRNRVFHIACPSEWIRGCASRSHLLDGMRLETIPNGLDVDVFRPHDKSLARNVLGLPPDDRIVLFGAVSSAKDRRKGFDLLLDALLQLTRSANSPAPTSLAVFGANMAEGYEAKAAQLPIRYLGTVRDEDTMALVYSAADVFVSPSRQDNLPNTVLEAQSCGLPCVAFRIGGIPDAIAEGQTGFLAAPFSTDELAVAISKALLLSRPETREATRRIAITRYSDAVVAARYLAYYRGTCDSAARIP